MNQPIKRYMPGLDGLRALSVIAVIAYHLNLDWAQGGLLGVGVFFVLSGYLITDHIILEWKTYNRLSIKIFWIRRIRRLVPAMFCMLLVVALWLIIIDPARLQALKGDFLSSIFYINNWYLIFHEVSYFESFAPPSPIGHLWSLSIEEQFYLLWPLLLVIGLKLLPRKGKMILWILTCAAISTIAMAIIYEPGSDPSRVYYGTDTRAFALLIGAALAIIWPSWKLSGRISSPARSFLDISGGIGILVLIVLIYRTNEYDDLLYRGGFLYLSMLTAVIIAVIVHPASHIGKLMGIKPFVWIGKRSYSLYIWHYPVIVLSTPVVNTEGPSFMRILMQIIASVILASLSYKYVEEPIRRGNSVMNLRLSRNEFLQKKHKIIAAVISLILILVSWGMYLARTDNNGDIPVINQESFLSQESQYTDSDETNTQKGGDITVVGDSVILGVAPILEKMLPGIIIDGEVGRQMSHAKEVINNLKAEGKLGNRIILEFGTNGMFNKDQLRSLLSSLQNTERIYLVTTRVSKDWEDIVNSSIREIADEFENTKVIDWYVASEGRNDIFYQDGVHLKPEGAEFYASMIAEAIKENIGQ
ncbi:MAG: acyltransferase family protein [Bacillota bacterium]